MAIAERWHLLLKRLPLLCINFQCISLLHNISYINVLKLRFWLKWNSNTPYSTSSTPVNICVTTSISNQLVWKHNRNNNRAEDDGEIQLVERVMSPGWSDIPLAWCLLPPPPWTLWALRLAHSDHSGKWYLSTSAHGHDLREVFTYSERECNDVTHTNYNLNEISLYRQLRPVLSIFL